MELINKTQLAKYKALAEKYLGEPAQLHFFTASVLLVLIFVLVYTPLAKKIDKNEKLLLAAKERNKCVVNYDKLQKQVKIFRPLIAAKPDTNAWISYMLDGLRRFRVRLHGMDSRPPCDVGPYQTAALSMEIEGPYSELKKYVEWLESSEGLLRIDMLQFTDDQKSLVMKILVLGIVPKK